jgi:hydrogenase nickel incorporation protein HypB
MTTIEINQDINALNNRIASDNRERFKTHGVYVINMMGSPGSGKTTLLENILPALDRHLNIAVIEGDLATRNDADRIKDLGIAAVQINTGGGCHLDAGMIEEQTGKLDLDMLDLIIIENVGNLVCPASFDLGEDMRMVVLSIAEGEDKPLKYPIAFLHADTAVITKLDLLPYVDADADMMKRYISDINPKAAIFETAKNNGIYSSDKVIGHILEQAVRKKIK